MLENPVVLHIPVLVEFVVKWTVGRVMSTISGDPNSKIFVSMKTNTEERISVPKLVTDATLSIPFSTCEVHELRLAYLVEGILIIELSVDSRV